MQVNVLGLTLVITGALIGYKPGLIYKIVKQGQSDQKQIIVIKSIGLMITIAGMLFIFFR